MPFPERSNTYSLYDQVLLGLITNGSTDLPTWRLSIVLLIFTQRYLVRLVGSDVTTKDQHTSRPRATGADACYVTVQLLPWHQ